MEAPQSVRTRVDEEMPGSSMDESYLVHEVQRTAAVNLASVLVIWKPYTEVNDRSPYRQVFISPFKVRFMVDRIFHLCSNAGNR